MHATSLLKLQTVIFWLAVICSVCSPGKGRMLGPSHPEPSGRSGLRPEQPDWRNRVSTELPRSDCRVLSDDLSVPMHMWPHGAFLPEKQAASCENEGCVLKYQTFLWVRASFQLQSVSDIISVFEFYVCSLWWLLWLSDCWQGSGFTVHQCAEV